MNAFIGFIIVVAYVGVLFVVCELLGFNKASDEH